MKLIKSYSETFLFSADPPSVTLQLGPSLNPDDIEEGDDCYFECIIKANPPTYKVVWRHNVSSYSLKLVFLTKV